MLYVLCFMQLICHYHIRGRKEEAVANLCRLRGVSEPGDVEMEISAIEAAAKAENSSSDSSMRHKVSALVSRSVLIPMALLVFLFFTQSFSGSNMVSYYTVTILQMAEIPMDENISAILVAAQYVLGYAISSGLVTRVGRRSLLISSLVLMMLANLGAGLVLFDKHEDTDDSHVNNVTDNAHVVIVDADNLVGLEASNDNQIQEESHGIYSYIPVISCVFITFGYACGLGPVPFILFGELFPSEFNSISSGFTM